MAAPFTIRQRIDQKRKKLAQRCAYQYGRVLIHSNNVGQNCKKTHNKLAEQSGRKKKEETSSSFGKLRPFSNYLFTIL